MTPLPSGFGFPSISSKNFSHSAFHSRTYRRATQVPDCFFKILACCSSFCFLHFASWYSWFSSFACCRWSAALSLLTILPVASWSH
jgi:hypothetical protein